MGQLAQTGNQAVSRGAHAFSKATFQGACNHVPFTCLLASSQPCCLYGQRHLSMLRRFSAVVLLECSPSSIPRARLVISKTTMFQLYSWDHLTFALWQFCLSFEPGPKFRIRGQLEAQLSDIEKQLSIKRKLLEHFDR